MERLTHATRLKVLFEELKNIILKDTFNKNQSLLLQSVKNEELDVTWSAAKSCVAEIERIFIDNGKFPERTSNAMLKPIQRVKLALSNQAFLKDFTNYSNHHLGQKLDDDLDLIDALLAEKEVFENFTEENIPQITEQIDELKQAILMASITDDLKKPLLSLLTRMEEIFEQYSLFGEQDLEVITERWAGTLVKYNQELANENKIKEQSLCLLKGLWKSYVFSGENIARIQAFNAVLPG